MTDRDRHHADLLLERKRTDQVYKKAVSELEDTSKKLMLAYNSSLTPVVDDNGCLYDGRGDVNSLMPALPSNAEIVALLRQGVELEQQLKSIDAKLKDYE